MNRKTLLTPRQYLRRLGLSPQEELFLLLYVVAGYNQVQAYSIAFDTKARGGLAALACHTLADFRLETAAQGLAEYIAKNGLKTPKKYN